MLRSILKDPIRMPRVIYTACDTEDDLSVVWYLLETSRGRCKTVILRLPPKPSQRFMPMT